MNFKLLLAFLGMIFLVAGCSSSLSGQQSGIGGTPDFSNGESNGNGLKMNFRTDDEWVSLREVSYELEFFNDGSETITLRAQDFSLSTIRRLQDGSALFYDFSVDDFYNNIFGDDNTLQLLPGQRTEFVGILELKESVYDDLNLEDFTYILTLSYNTRTEFSTGAEFDKTQRELSTDSLRMGAPVKVTRIDMRPRNNDFFDILFYARDVGTGDTTDTSRVAIDYFDFAMGSSPLTCDPYYEDGGRKIGLDGSDTAITKEISELIFSCSFDTSVYDDGITNTIITGELEYTYSLTTSGTVRLPDVREDGFFY